MEVEESTLIVAANVADTQIRQAGVFDFILVSGGGGKRGTQITGLRVDTGAIVLVSAVPISRVEIPLQGVGFASGKRVLPVRAGCKRPA